MYYFASCTRQKVHLVTKQSSQRPPEVRDWLRSTSQRCQEILCQFNPQFPKCTQWMSGGVSVSVRSQTGLLSRLDTCMSPHKQLGDMCSDVSGFFCWKTRLPQVSIGWNSFLLWKRVTRTEKCHQSPHRHWGE